MFQRNRLDIKFKINNHFFLENLLVEFGDLTIFHGFFRNFREI